MKELPGPLSGPWNPAIKNFALHGGGGALFCLRSKRAKTKQTNKQTTWSQRGGGECLFEPLTPPPPQHPLHTNLDTNPEFQNSYVTSLPCCSTASAFQWPKFRVIILNHSHDIRGIYSIQLHEQQSFTVWSLFLDCNILYLYLRVGRAILHCGTALVVQWPHHRAVILHGNHSYDIEGILHNHKLHG